MKSLLKDLVDCLHYFVLATWFQALQKRERLHNYANFARTSIEVWPVAVRDESRPDSEVADILDRWKTLYAMKKSRNDVKIIRRADHYQLPYNPEVDLTIEGDRKVLTNDARLRLTAELRKIKREIAEARARIAGPVLATLASLIGAYIGATLKH